MQRRSYLGIRPGYLQILTQIKTSMTLIAKTKTELPIPINCAV